MQLQSSAKNQWVSNRTLLLTPSTADFGSKSTTLCLVSASAELLVLVHRLSLQDVIEKIPSSLRLFWLTNDVTNWHLGPIRALLVVSQEQWIAYIATCLPISAATCITRVVMTTCLLLGNYENVSPSIFTHIFTILGLFIYIYLFIITPKQHKHTIEFTWQHGGQLAGVV